MTNIDTSPPKYTPAEIADGGICPQCGWQGCHGFCANNSCKFFDQHMSGIPKKYEPTQMTDTSKPWAAPGLSVEERTNEIVAGYLSVTRTGSLKTIIREAIEAAVTDSRAWSAEDAPLPEDAAIRAAHPLRTGDQALYLEAERLVHAKRSKYALVDLVNWLLYKRKKAVADERQRFLDVVRSYRGMGRIAQKIMEGPEGKL